MDIRLIELAMACILPFDSFVRNRISFFLRILFCFFLRHTFTKRNHHERETERIPQDSGLRVNPHARHLGQYSLAAISALSIFS
jgi:hypothetical protein